MHTYVVQNSQKSNLKKEVKNIPSAALMALSLILFILKKEPGAAERPLLTHLFMSR